VNIAGARDYRLAEGTAQRRAGSSHQEAAVSTHQHEETRMQVPPPPSFPPPPPRTPRLVHDLEVIHDTVQPLTPSPRAPRPAQASRPRLRLADRRGLTGLGAVALVLVVAAIAGAIDGQRSGDGLGWIFGVTFVICCVAAALMAHPEDMGAVAILPPLAFLVGAFACAAFRPGVADVSFTHKVVNELLIALLIGAPSLFVAEAFTLVTTGLRGLRHRALARARRAS
jgi:hypothetical protein